MRLTRYRPTTHACLELSGTSLIDVVFLLLIFFMTTTTFLSAERQVQPSIVVERQFPGALKLNIEPLEIAIVRSEGVAVFRIGATESPDPEFLQQILARYPDPSAGAWIRLSDDVPFGMAAVAVNACEAAGFEAISLVPLR